MSGSGISWAICKSEPRSRQITTPAPHHSVFYRPDAQPAASNQNTRACKIVSYKTWHKMATTKHCQIAALHSQPVWTRLSPVTWLPQIESDWIECFLVFNWIKLNCFLFSVYRLWLVYTHIHTYFISATQSTHTLKSTCKNNEGTLVQWLNEGHSAS